MKLFYEKNHIVLAYTMHTIHANLLSSGGRLPILGALYCLLILCINHAAFNKCLFIYRVLGSKSKIKSAKNLNIFRATEHTENYLIFVAKGKLPMNKLPTTKPFRGNIC